MDHISLPIGSRKRIALIAHDHKKKDLLEWAKFNRDALAQHIIIGTGTTGRLLEQTLNIEVIKLQSGPLGGDQQIGAKIAEGEIDFAIFFWDPPRITTPRPRRKSPAAAGRCVEYPHCLQSGLC